MILSIGKSFHTTVISNFIYICIYNLTPISIYLQELALLTTDQVIDQAILARNNESTLMNNFQRSALERTAALALQRAIQPQQIEDKDTLSETSPLHERVTSSYLQGWSRLFVLKELI